MSATVIYWFLCQCFFSFILKPFFVVVFEGVFESIFAFKHDNPTTIDFQNTSTLDLLKAIFYSSCAVQFHLPRFFSIQCFKKILNWRSLSIPLQCLGSHTVRFFMVSLSLFEMKKQVSSGSCRLLSTKIHWRHSSLTPLTCMYTNYLH